MGQWQSRHVEEEEFVKEIKEMSYEEKQAAVTRAREATPSDAYLFGYLDRIIAFGEREINELIVQAIIQAPTIECLQDDRVPPLIRRLIKLSRNYNQQQALLGVFTKYLERGLYHDFICEYATDLNFILRIGIRLKDRKDLEDICKWVESMPWTAKLFHFFCSSFFKMAMAKYTDELEDEFENDLDMKGYDEELEDEDEDEDEDDDDEDEDEGEHKYEDKDEDDEEKDEDEDEGEDEYEDKDEEIDEDAAKHEDEVNDHFKKEYKPSPRFGRPKGRHVTTITTIRERNDLRLQELDNLNKLHAHDPKAPWFVNPLLLPTDHSKVNYCVVGAHKTQLGRVAELYQRCPVPGYDIKSVQVVYNERLTTMFSGRVKMLQKRTHNAAFTPHWADSNDLISRTKVMELFHSLCHPYKAAPNVSLIPLWHGSNPANLEGIFATGYANLATTDSGFFGKGIYGTPEAEYAHRVYSQGALLLNWVAVFSAYPVIYQDEEQLAEKANFGNYDAHFVPVYSPKHPNTKVYHACNYGEEAQYSELVVFDSAQVLPQFIVELQPSLIPNPPLLPLPDAPTTTTHQPEETSNTEVPDPPHSPSTSHARDSVPNSDAARPPTSLLPTTAASNEASSSSSPITAASNLDSLPSSIIATDKQVEKQDSADETRNPKV